MKHSTSYSETMDSKFSGEISSLMMAMNPLGFDGDKTVIED